MTFGQRSVRLRIATLCTVSLIGSSLPAAPPALNSPAEMIPGAAGTSVLSVVDLVLASGHEVQGTLLDAEGKPVEDVEVSLWRGGRLVRRTRSRADGSFVLGHVTAGGYEIRTASRVCPCRVWTAQTAPPKARQSVLIVDDPEVVRGQRPVRDLFLKDPWLMAGLVAAAIAIPIAIHKSRDDAPPGS